MPKKPVKCYLSPDELKVLDHMARKSGEKRSAVLRKALLYLAHVTEGFPGYIFLQVDGVQT